MDLPQKFRGWESELSVQAAAGLPERRGWQTGDRAGRSSHRGADLRDVPRRSAGQDDRANAASGKNRDSRKESQLQQEHDHEYSTERKILWRLYPPENRYGRLHLQNAKSESGRSTHVHCREQSSSDYQP